MRSTFRLTAFLAIPLIPASADTITILSASNVAGANAALNTWLTNNFVPGSTTDTLTTFENDADGHYSSLSTGIGTFSTLPGGLGSTGTGTGKNQFSVLDSADTTFNGRYNTTPGGKNWLDSNDITKLQLTTTYDSIYFFITDVNDCGGNLSIQTADGSSASFSKGNANGNIFFVGITGPDAIGYVQWLESNRSDGYGLDDFGIVNLPFNPPQTVPEPATWIVAACALLIVAAAVQVRERQATRPVEPNSRERREARRPGR